MDVPGRIQLRCSTIFSLLSIDDLPADRQSAGTSVTGRASGRAVCNLRYQAERSPVTGVIERVRPILDRPFFYEFYHSLIGANHRSRVLVSEYIRPKPHDRILDIGCGPGNMLPFLPVCQYLGVDANPTCIAFARQRYSNRGEFM